MRILAARHRRLIGLGSQPTLTKPAIESVYEFEREIALVDAVQIMLGPRQRSPLSSKPKLGVQAIVNVSGGDSADH